MTHVTAPSDIMRLAHAYGDARAEHAVAVKEFGHDRGPYSAVQKAKKRVEKTEAALRKAAEALR